MKQAIILILISLTCLESQAQVTRSRIKVSVSSRVETSKKEVKAILNLYENYINSRPDSIYDNPYWNKAEKTKYKDFDFSRESIFQNGISPTQLFRVYPPFVMSVEPIGKKYQIRVLFSSSNTDLQYIGTRVWCIQKLNAKKEAGNWVLENLIVELTKEWTTNTIGQIRYVYPTNHEFDLEEAKRSIPFCRDIIKRFNPNYKSMFNYYVCSNIDDMGLLENFDYYFVGYTTGKMRESMLITAKGNEYYPHEFVHQLLPLNPYRSRVIDEGLATFLGTKDNLKEYENDYLSKLAFDLKNNNEKINFRSVLAQETPFNGYQTYYPAGAAICELVYKLKGDEGLRLLMQANTLNYDFLISELMCITELPLLEIEKEWNEIVLKYLP